MTTFRDTLFRERQFAITCELIPGRGHQEKSIDSIMRFVDAARGSPDVQALSLTDNAGGNPAICADVLGAEILRHGVDVIVHFATKDLNRNLFESRSYSLQRSGISNLLIVSGDYPVAGYLGTAKPVFDIDSTLALHYLSSMNRGLPVEAGARSHVLKKTDFLLGAAVSPFKWTEGPAVMQYIKLEKKMRAGAHFAVTQLGYDVRKYVELLRYVRQHLGSDMPLLGSVYVLTAGASRIMAKGEIPGCYATPELVSVLQEEAGAEDKGRGARLERASRMVAILRGLGYNGAHIEGLNLRFEDVREILGRAREIGENWRDHLSELLFAPQKPYYLFAGGEELPAPADLPIVSQPRSGRPAMSATRRGRILSLAFWSTRLLHRLIFVENTLGYRTMRLLSRFAEAHRWFYVPFALFERISKQVLFDCRECDDCALFEMYYLCPESRCPKGMRNGACGGSRVDGTCEVYESKWCVWHMVYWRAKNRRQVEKLRYVIPPRDWKLYETSSWVNYFLRHDHSGHPLQIATLESRRRVVPEEEGASVRHG